MTIIYSLICFCLLIMIHELGHFFAAKAVGIQVNELALGMGPLLFKHQGKETLYSLRLLPIGGFCRMEGEDEESDNERAFNKKGAPQRALVVIAGALMNLLTAILILSIIGGYMGVATPQLSEVTEGGPAYTAGIRAGDKIIEVNGEKVQFFSDVRAGIQSSEEEVELVLHREGSKVYATVPLEKSEEGVPVIGIIGTVSHSPVEAVRYGLYATKTMGAEMLSFFGSLFTGGSSVEDLSGPVGIVSAIGESAKLGLVYVANLMAMISLNLAILNMLPLPALDGGRFLIILINAVTGKAISEDVEGKIHFAGLVLLMGLMVYVLIQDVGRLL